MRAIPMRSASVARRMPRPVVNTMQAVVPVDLKPSGNTVALTTTSQNPFTDARTLTVKTQASGGMAAAPSEMQSRSIMHQFVPGLGGDANGDKQGVPATQPSNWGDQVAAVVTPLQQFTPLLLQAEQRLSQAQASGDPQAVAEAQNYYAEIERRRQRMLYLTVGGGIAAVGVLAYFMFFRRKRR